MDFVQPTGYRNDVQRSLQFSNATDIANNLTERVSSDEVPLDTIVNLLVASIGVPCNLMITITAWKHITFSLKYITLLMLLAVADTLYLISSILSRKGIFGELGQSGTVFHCSILKMFTMISALQSSWITVVICIERIIVICQPIKSYLLNKKKGLIMVFICPLFLSFILSNRCFIMSKHCKRDFTLLEKCSVLPQDHSGLSWLPVFILTTIYGILPPFIVTVLNILTIKVFIRQTRFRKNIKFSAKNTDASNVTRKTRSVTIMLLVSSFTFMAFRMPGCLVLMTSSVFKKQFGSFDIGGWLVWLDAGCKILDMINPSDNLLLYLITGSDFRAKFCHILNRKYKCSCKKIQKNAETYN